jgi:hypothetical protein
MYRYFPGIDIPEEIFFEILKILHPGAIWLLCRPVSRAWRSHIDANIERYYKAIAKRLSDSEAHDGIDYFDEYQADTIVIHLSWPEMSHRRLINDQTVPLRVSSIELPSGCRPRNSNVMNWKERVTFKAEENSVRTTGLSVHFISRLLFPNFYPSKRPKRLELRKEEGTFTAKYSNYFITYKVEKRPEGLDDDNDPYWMLNSERGLPKFNYSIVEISVSVGELLTFRCPYRIARKPTLSIHSTYLLRLDSEIFDTVDDELDHLPSSWEKRRAEGYDRWKMYSTSRSICEKCDSSGLDWWCEDLLCAVCCKRKGFCKCHDMEYQMRRHFLAESMQASRKYTDFRANIALASVYAWEHLHWQPLLMHMTGGDHLTPKFAQEMPERERSPLNHELRRVKSCSSLGSGSLSTNTLRSGLRSQRQTGKQSGLSLFEDLTDEDDGGDDGDDDSGDDDSDEDDFGDGEDDDDDDGGSDIDWEDGADE